MEKQRKHYAPEEKVAIRRRHLWRVHPAGNAPVAERRSASGGYVDHYNNVRLNSAVGYITPKEMLAGRRREIHAESARKLEVARKQRQVRRQQDV